MRTQLRIVAGALRGRKLSCDVNVHLRPTPQMVFSANDAISVAAHGKLVKKYEIPAALAAQLSSSSAATNNAQQNMPVMSTTTFGVMIKSV